MFTRCSVSQDIVVVQYCRLNKYCVIYIYIYRLHHSNEQPTQPPTTKHSTNLQPLSTLHVLNPKIIIMICLHLCSHNSDHHGKIISRNNHMPWKGNGIRLSRKRMIHIIGAATIMTQTDPIDKRQHIYHFLYHNI